VDTDKWKSVAVSIDIYKMLKIMAQDTDRSVSKQVAHIVKKEFNQPPYMLDETSEEIYLTK